MKKSLPIGILMACVLITSAIYAQNDTIAFWGFNTATADYLYWGVDDENGTTRPWVVNEYKDRKDVTFGAFREGMRDNEPIAFYEGNHTMGTTTILGTNCLAQQAWHRDDEMGRTDRYWLLDNVSTIDMENIVVSLYLTCAGTGGPGKAKFGYRIGDGAWVEDADFKDIRGGVTAGGNFIGTNPADLWVHNLPAACNNQERVSCRWLVNDVRADGTTAISNVSYSRVDDVMVKGTSVQTGLNGRSYVNYILSGKMFMANETMNLEVFNQVGVKLISCELASGSGVEIPSGLSILKVTSNGERSVMKIIVR